MATKPQDLKLFELLEDFDTKLHCNRDIALMGLKIGIAIVQRLEDLDESVREVCNTIRTKRSV